MEGGMECCEREEGKGKEAGGGREPTSGGTTIIPYAIPKYATIKTL